MKKLLKATLLSSLLSATLMADVVFDLGAQQFYYCVTDKTNDDDTTSDQYVEASYDIGTAIASTGLISEKGYYRPADYGSGHFGVQIKEPKANWGVNLSMYAYIHSDGTNVALLGADGKAVNIGFDYDEISVDGKVIEDKGFHLKTEISLSAQMQGENIHIVVNGQHVFDVKRPNFKLAKVDVSLFTEGSSAIYDIDKLNSLSISTSD